MEPIFFIAHHIGYGAKKNAEKIRSARE